MTVKKTKMFMLLLVFILTVVGLPESPEKQEAVELEIQDSTEKSEITLVNDAAEDSNLAVINDITEVSDVAKINVPAVQTATVIFTFDDGYASDYELAYAILKKYGIRATSYIIPEYQDTNRPHTLT